eukprot:CAMPEP_0198136298 /NCGR_PEP_ID=MMETSP1442-20131203/61037_1 /TAXON_ID= /ORGANISM="Craspedostauros australis, Strain CCMP3328" /LENGTH=410 /DNA_ID=CAMNT_0043797507 /DNA_START=1006 /DNA_END=2238 /DNA_ORIENTATION=+
MVLFSMFTTMWMLLLLSLDAVTSFTLGPFTPSMLSTPTITRTALHSSSIPNSDNDNSDDNDDTPPSNLDSMRSMLESSWTAKSMGQVASDPQAAAEEAAMAIQNASNDGKNLSLVHLALPAYDITQGENLYDAVVAVEFCAAVAEELESQSLILVRDAETVKLVSSVFARKAGESGVGVGDKVQAQAQSQSQDKEDDKPESNEDVVSDASETDAFRKQLMAGWNTDGGDASDGNKAVPAPTPTDSGYRLASLFGKKSITQGPNMIQDILQAVQSNALPQSDEETIIVLCAVTREEMVAIRSLVGKYANARRFVLVNCFLDPLPKELLKAETVYSIMPLMAQATDRNVFKNSEETPPKIVVLRRYPRDWEVHVDIGNGFELADQRVAGGAAMGPPMEWVVGVVKRHLQLNA